MNTILVVYTNELSLSKKDIRTKKAYAFNTNSTLKEGDLIKTKEYDTRILVIKVLENAFKYYNSTTGELSNDFTSTAQREIVTLEIREDDEEIIYGSLVNRVS